VNRKDKAQPNELLQYERKQRGWPRRYVADQVGVAEESLVGKWERQGVMPRPENLARLCQLFGKSVRELGFVKKGEVPYWNVPHPPDPFFTGRDDVLTFLHQVLTPGKDWVWSQTVAVTGLEGVGKTEVAVEYAYCYRNEYHAIFWVKAEAGESMISDFDAIARLLHLPGYDEKDQEKTLHVLHQWMESINRWLLILDNVEDMNSIRRFFPQKGRGCVLLTTRMHATNFVPHVIELGGLEPDEGAHFLLQRAKLLASNRVHGRDISELMEQAKELSRLLGGLPFALEEAAAYIEETGCSLTEYLQLRRVDSTPFFFEHPIAASTFRLSFEKVKQSQPLAAELLKLLAFLHPDAIPEEIILDAAGELGPDLKILAGDKLRLNLLLGELLRYSLIKRSQDILSMHRLVQAVLKSTLDQIAQRQWAERAICAVNSLFPEVHPATWDTCERLLSSAQTCSDLVIRYQIASPESARLLDLAGYYLYERGRYAESETLLSQALRIRERVMGREHRDRTISLDHLGLLYKAQGELEKAQPLFQRALTILEKELGPEHPETATILYHQGLLYHASGKYADARSLYLRAFSIKKRNLSRNHPDIAVILDDLAVLTADMGNYARAITLEQLVLSLKQRLFGEVHPDIAVSLGNLAAFYHASGQYEIAAPLYLHAAETFEQTLGTRHPSTFMTYDNLAGLYIDQGKYEEALHLSEKVLRSREQVLGKEHPDLCQSLVQLGLIYQARRAYAKAHAYFKRSLNIYEKVYGLEHPYTAGSQTYLADVLTLLGRADEAYILVKLALAYKKRTLGADHPSFATTLNSLAAIHYAQGDIKQARMYAEQALKIREKTLHPSHLQLAESLLALARLATDENHLNEAATLLERAIIIQEQAKGADHPDVQQLKAMRASVVKRLASRDYIDKETYSST
jgi:tetratricopeptide (TPR) repeat protein/transcriptional regulator with XRE-family HTH domain